MTETRTALVGYALTDTGRRRLVNEDRVLVDVEAGWMLVIDGMGGHNAGLRAATIALEIIPERMNRLDAPLERRLREAITLANNTIFADAQNDPACAGMACVVAAAGVEDGEWVIGHVGDSRILEVLPGCIRPLTRDHSPLAVLEESGQLTEAQAMAHEKRHLVSRDVGGRMRRPDEPGFIEVRRVPFRPDQLLLGCSDGVSDMLTSQEIRQLVEQNAGNPEKVAHAIVAAANEHGGRDNISVAILEGPEFASALRVPVSEGEPVKTVPARPGVIPIPSRWKVAAAMLLVFLGGLAAGQYSQWTWQRHERERLRLRPRVLRVNSEPDGIRTISAALAQARPGDTVLIAPGEYRENIRLREGVAVVAEESRGAVLESPGPVAVLAAGLKKARLQGLMIAPTSGAQLQTGVLVMAGEIEIEGVEISGATNAAVEYGLLASGRVRSSFLHDNPGTGIRSTGATLVVESSVLMRNGMLGKKRAALEWEPDAPPFLTGNAFGHNGAPLPLSATEARMICARNLCTDEPPRLRSNREAAPGKE
jgi:serine/threonine protein phosphatase PrpC